MEQINRGILKLMTFPNGAHVNGTKFDPGAKREEPIFDALLNQKQQENRSQEEYECPGDRPSETDARQEPVESKKEPVATKKKEETCDVAREVACAQIVWLNRANAADLLVPQKLDSVASIEQPMIIADIAGAVEVVAVSAEQVAVDIPTEGKIQLPEDVLLAEPEVMGEQVVETVAQSELPEMEMNLNGQNVETPEIEITVRRSEDDEVNPETVEVNVPLFKDVETAPIKVAEAPERAEKAPDVEQQVVEKLTNVLENGETKVEIQLDPAELGKLTIELTRSADGTLSILMNAENSQTRGLLERHIGSLQETLSDRGQQNVQITVNQGAETQRQGNQENQEQYNNFQDNSSGRQGEQQQRRHETRSGEDFLQQLRLGLIPLEEEEDK